MATLYNNTEESYLEVPLSFGKVTLSVTILVILYLFSMILNYGIVYYEQEVSDLHRTLINKLVAVGCVINMVMATNSFILHVLSVILLGRVKLHPGACVAYRFITVSSAMQIILLYNEVSWLRYIYLKRGTIGSLDDGLVSTFLIIFNAVMGLIAGTLRIIPPGSSLINIKTICHRKDYEIYGMFVPIV